MATSETELPFLAVLKHVPTAIMLVNLDGIIVFYNAQAEKLFGYSQNEVVGKSIEFVVPFPFQDTHTQARLQYIITPYPRVNNRHLNLVARRKDGNQFAADIQFKPLTVDNRQWIICVVHNVSEQVENKEARITSENFLNEAQRVAHLGSWEMDIATGESRWSDEFFRICGYAPGEFEPTAEIGLQIVHPEDRQRAREAVTTAVSGSGQYHIEKRIVRSDGEVRHVIANGRVIYDDNNQPDKLLGTFQDITERKQVEEELRQSEARFRAVWERSPDAMAISDAEGIVLAANPAYYQLYGYTPEEVIGHSFAIIFPPEERTWALQQYKTIFNSSEAPPTFESQVQKADGTMRHVETRIEFIVQNDQRVAMLSNIRDITERKQTEEKLKQSEIRLRQVQKMEAVGRLAGGIAHDFNNILTAILSYSDLLLLSFPNKEDKVHKHLEQIGQAAERAANLTQQLLTFSRQQMLTPSILDLNTVVLDMTNMLRRLIGEDIELVTQLADGVGLVRVDKGQLEQVIMNLVVNARDAMPTGGRLLLETADVYLDKTVDHQHMEVQAGSYTMLAVTDTGVGMSEEVQARIFEPFFTTKEVGKGTGLGLSMVYGVVRQSGGYIWVDSKPGQSTTFKIYLPQVEETAETSKPDQDPGMDKHGKETVLLVEDEDVVRDVVRDTLEMHGYHVLEAIDEEAMEVCQHYSGQIDLLLTDVVMPGLSGPVLADKITRMRPAISVLYMSGYTDDLIVQHGVSSPDVAFLPKPFTSQTLAKKVRQVLDDARQG